MCILTIFICLQKIRSVRGCSRNLWQKTHLAGTQASLLPYFVINCDFYLNWQYQQNFYNGLFFRIKFFLFQHLDCFEYFSLIFFNIDCKVIILTTDHSINEYKFRHEVFHDVLLEGIP